jgi:hypothetical protein
MRRVLMLASGLWLCAAALVPTGCSTVAQVGTMAGQAAGVITAEQAESINRTAAAVEKTYQDITPEQEYYMGGRWPRRCSAPTSLTTPGAEPVPQRVGADAGALLRQPETFGGYHFLALETEEVNAFAAPAG